LRLANITPASQDDLTHPSLWRGATRSSAATSSSADPRAAPSSPRRC